MPSIIHDATHWVVGHVADYPKQLAVKGVMCLTDAVIDKCFPNQKDSEACKLLKELTPEIILIIGDSLYQAVTKPTEKNVKELTGKMESSVPSSLSRETLKKILKLVHDRL